MRLSSSNTVVLTGGGCDVFELTEVTISIWWAVTLCQSLLAPSCNFTPPAVQDTLAVHFVLVFVTAEPVKLSKYVTVVWYLVGTR